jgi:hypothetical protein
LLEGGKSRALAREEDGERKGAVVIVEIGNLEGWRFDIARIGELAHQAGGHA